MKMTRKKALFSLTGASLIVGSTIVVSRLISLGKSIYCLQAVSLLIASVILIISSGAGNIKKYLIETGKRDFMYIFFQTLSGVVLFRILIIYGVKLTSSIDAGVILSLTPLMTVLLSMIFLQEKIGKKEVPALFLASAGVLILNLNSNNNCSSAGMRLAGNSMVFLAVTGESAFVIFSKKVSRELPAIYRSLLVCLFGFIMMAPVAVYEILKENSFLADPGFWLLAGYTGAVLTAAAYILWFRGIIHVSGTTAGIFNTLIPVSSIFLVFAVTGETISMKQCSGLIFILSGVFLIIFKGAGNRIKS